MSAVYNLSHQEDYNLEVLEPLSAWCSTLSDNRMWLWWYWNVLGKRFCF